MQICKQCEDGIISEIRPTGLARMPLASVGALCLNRKCQCDPVINNMNRSTIVSRDCKLLSIKMKTIRSVSRVTVASQTGAVLCVLHTKDSQF